MSCCSHFISFPLLINIMTLLQDLHSKARKEGMQFQCLYQGCEAEETRCFCIFEINGIIKNKRAMCKKRSIEKLFLWVLGNTFTPYTHSHRITKSCSSGLRWQAFLDKVYMNILDAFFLLAINPANCGAIEAMVAVGMQ